MRRARCSTHSTAWAPTSRSPRSRQGHGRTVPVRHEPGQHQTAGTELLARPGATALRGCRSLPTSKVTHHRRSQRRRLCRRRPDALVIHITGKFAKVRRRRVARGSAALATRPAPAARPARRRSRSHRSRSTPFHRRRGRHRPGYRTAQLRHHHQWPHVHGKRDGRQSRCRGLRLRQAELARRRRHGHARRRQVQGHRHQQVGLSRRPTSTSRCSGRRSSPTPRARSTRST